MTAEPSTTAKNTASAGRPFWPSRRSDSAKLFVIAILAQFVIAAAIWSPKSATERIRSMLIDEPLPKFAMPALSLNDPLPGYGNKSLLGGVSVINFFASWCYPCLQEHGFISKISRSGLAKVFGHNFKDQPVHAMRWLKQHGNPYYAVGSDLTGEVARLFKVAGIPDTFIVDKSGRVRYQHGGAISAKAMRHTIMPVIRTLNRE